MANASGIDLDPLNFSLWLNSEQMEKTGNTASYVFRPPCAINVPSNAYWRVALVSISIPRRIINLNELRAYAKTPTISKGSWRVFLLKTCFCSTPDEMAYNFNSRFQQKMGEVASLGFDASSNRFTLTISAPQTSVKFSDELAQYLGFDSATTYSETTEANLPHDLFKGKHYVFVETDLIVPTFQNFILETFAIPESSAGDLVYTFRAKKPIYFAVKPACISEIRMSLKNEQGELLQYEMPFPPVIAQFQFRRKGYFV